VGQTSACPRQSESSVRRPHHLQQRGAHERQKGDEGGDRISRKPENQAAVAFAEQKGFAGFYGHAPEVDLRADLAQRFAHQVMLPY